MERARSFYFVLFCTLFFGGCAPSVQSQVISPYVRALQTYYEELADGDTEFPKSLEIIQEALKTGPNNLNLNTLRAQILLNKYRFQGEGETRAELITQIRDLDGFTLLQSSTKGWIVSELYATLGDLLLLEAEALTNNPGRATDGIYNATEALLYHKTAVELYKYAYKNTSDIKASESTNALERVKQRIQDGLLAAQLGIVEALNALKSIAISRVLDEKIDEATKILEEAIPRPNGNGNSTRAEEFANLDAQFHKNMGVIYSLLLPNISSELNEICQLEENYSSLQGEVSNLDKEVRKLINQGKSTYRTGQLAQLDKVERASMHFILYRLFSPSDNDLPDYKRGLDIIRKFEDTYLQQKPLCTN